MKTAEVRERLTALDELLEDGDVAAARAAVASWLTTIGGGVKCPVCSATFDWPGIRDDHLFRVHPDEPLEVNVAA